jgi:hypothetical protein
MTQPNPAVTICLALLPAFAASARGPSCGQATYEVRFTAEWSQSTHPVSFPNNAHFSPLIGGTHGPDVVFWAPGALASPGIESMAETGAVTTLRNEVQAAVNNATAWGVLQGGDIPVSPGERTLTFTADTGYPLVTLVSMIAPSPDWFVGVHGLSLRENGAWAPEVTAELWPYDAGTDSGVNYTSPNADTNPAQPIQLLTTGAFAGTGRMGTMTFTLVQTTGCDAADLAEPCGVRDFFDVAAYLSLYNAGDPAADFAAPFGTLNFFDVTVFLTAYVNGCP